jgi:hypothetical protein
VGFYCGRRIPKPEAKAQTKAWNSADEFCAAVNGTPTISNGKIYVPTYALDADGAENCPPDTSVSYYSGLLVYY